MATTTTEEASTGLEGPWNVTWRGGAIAPQTGVLTLTRTGESLVVHLETEEGAGSCEAAVDGDNLSWTITLGEDPAPLQFAAILEGHRLSGQVARNLEGTVWEMATLEGSRVGFDVEARSREGVDALADTLIACGVEYVFGYCCAGSMVPAVLDRIPNMAARNDGTAPISSVRCLSSLTSCADRLPNTSAKAARSASTGLCLAGRARYSASRRESN